MIGLTINNQTAPALKELSRGLAPNTVALVGGRALANRIRARFNELEQTRPNKQGWPRQHFWSQVRRSVQNPVPIGDGQVRVSVNHVGAALRFFGGIVRPVRAKLLTVPAAAEAYGKRAREFSDLRIGFAPDEEGHQRLALVRTRATQVSFGRKRKDGTRKVKQGEEVGGEAVFWLNRKATFNPDPSVLPTQQQLQEEAAGALTRYRDRLIARQNGGGPAINS